MISGFRSGFRLWGFGVRVRVVGFEVSDSGQDVGFRLGLRLQGFNVQV